MRYSEFKLDELTGIKKYQHLTVNELLKVISADTGLKILGQGAFGKVIDSPSEHFVYKIFDFDPAYEMYLEFVQNNPNKHFPKIYKIKEMTSFYRRYSIQPEKFTVVKIEKLYKVPRDKLRFAVLLCEYPEDEVARFLPDSRLNRRYTFTEIMKQSWPGWEDGEMASLKQAADSIRVGELSRQFGNFVDFHSGNLMQRKDGTIVIIDPIASENSLDHKRALQMAKQQEMSMIKGPHYKTQMAPPNMADDDEDEIDSDDIYSLGPSQTPPFSYGAYNQVLELIKWFEEKSSLTSTEEAQLNKLKILHDKMLDRKNKMKVSEIVKETATAGATSAANVGTVVNPHHSPGKARGKKSYIGDPWGGQSGTKSPPQPKVVQPKNSDGTAKNGADMPNLFGAGAIKRK